MLALSLCFEHHFPIVVPAPHQTALPSRALASPSHGTASASDSGDTIPFLCPSSPRGSSIQLLTSVHFLCSQFPVLNSLFEMHRDDSVVLGNKDIAVGKTGSIPDLMELIVYQGKQMLNQPSVA